MRFRSLGPNNRRTKVEFCACGTAYTTYWTHRETKHHKDAVRRWRQEDRERRLHDKGQRQA